MSCPTDAHLRAHIDDHDGDVADHVTTCRQCARQLDGVADDARFAAEAIAGLDDTDDRGIDTDAALTALQPAQTPAARRAARLRVPLSIAAGVVALAVVGFVLLTPTGRRAAADLLSGFRSERFEVVTFDPEQPLDGLDRLGEIADVDADGARSDPVEVADMAAAADIVGFVPAAVTTLPDGAELRSVQAAAPGSVRLTLRADRAPDLDGAQLTVSVPGIVAAMYDVDGRTLVVGEAGQLAVDAEGGDLADIRAYLLGRPEVPQDLASQLLAIDDWTTTVPIPVPVDEVVWRETTVGDAPGLMLSDPVGSGLLWQADGRIHALGAEGLDIDVLRDIADGIG